MTEIEIWRKNQTRKMEMMARVAASDARNLAEQMTRLATMLEAEGPAASFNRLGEVQGAGLTIDARLTALAVLRDAVTTFDQSI
jgi:hypothetical protein